MAKELAHSLPWKLPVNQDVIIEFYGNEYHGWPDGYKVADVNHLGFQFGDLYNVTIERETILKSSGYTIIRMWEHRYKDWKKTKDGPLHQTCEIC